jgi:hypothetical protein
MANFAQLAQTIQFATGQLDVRQNLRASLAFDCANEQDAERVRGAVAALLGMGRLNMPEDGGESQQVFDGMQVYRERNVVRFSTDVPFDLLEKSPFLGPLFGVK